MSDEDLLLVAPRDRSLVVPLPRSWELVPDPEAPVVLAAVEPDVGQGFRATVVVTVEPVPAEVSLQTWQQHVEDSLAGSLADHLLVDTEVSDHRGRPRYRRLVHHLAESGEPLSLQQWAVRRADGAEGVTLSLTVRTDRFVDVAPLATEVAAGFDPWRSA